LATERAYTLRTLPTGIGRGLQAALRQGDMAGIARGAAIVAGLGVTAAGYAVGNLSLRTTPIAPPLDGADADTIKWDMATAAAYTPAMASPHLAAPTPELS